jgi:hypothetical protein
LILATTGRVIESDWPAAAALTVMSPEVCRGIAALSIPELGTAGIAHLHRNGPANLFFSIADGRIAVRNVKPPEKASFTKTPA